MGVNKGSEWASRRAWRSASTGVKSTEEMIENSMNEREKHKKHEWI